MRERRGGGKRAKKRGLKKRVLGERS